MTTPPDHKAKQLPSSIRMDARLDPTTREKVDDLAQRFRQPRAAVVCHIMHWGLSREQPETLDHGTSQGPVRHLYFYVASDLHERVEKASAAVGLKTAAWLRHMIRQITIEDFPASWQEATPVERSHDSRTYDMRFMLRLDEASQTKLQQLITQFGASKAEIIRQLITQAEPKDFPSSWHIRAAEHRVHTRYR